MPGREGSDRKELSSGRQSRVPGNGPVAHAGHGCVARPELIFSAASKFDVNSCGQSQGRPAMATGERFRQVGVKVGCTIMDDL